MVRRLISRIFDAVMSDVIHGSCHFVVAAVVLDFRHVNYAKTSETTLVADWEVIIDGLVPVSAASTLGNGQVCIAIFVV